MEWRHHGDESEYVKTSNAKFEQLRGYAQQFNCERHSILMEWRHPVMNPSM